MIIFSISSLTTSANLQQSSTNLQLQKRSHPPKKQQPLKHWCVCVCVDQSWIGPMFLYVNENSHINSFLLLLPCILSSSKCCKISSNKDSILINWKAVAKENGAVCAASACACFALLRCQSNPCKCLAQVKTDTVHCIQLQT